MIYLQLIDGDENKSIFEQVYHTYRDLMYWVAFRLLNNKENAEDAVHQAFVKIAEQIKKFRIHSVTKRRASSL